MDYCITNVIFDYLNSEHLFCLQSVFVVTLGSFVFFNVQKTKYLQVLTTLMRWGGKKLILNSAFCYVVFFYQLKLKQIVI